VHNALDAVDEEQMEDRFTMGLGSIYDQIFQASRDVVFLHTVFSAWHTMSIRSSRLHFSSQAAPPNSDAALGRVVPNGDTPLQLNFNEDVFGQIPHPWLHGDSAPLRCNFDEDIWEGCDQPKGLPSLAKGRRERLGSRSRLSVASSAAADARRVLKRCNLINNALTEFRPSFETASTATPTGVRPTFDTVSTDLTRDSFGDAQIMEPVMKLSPEAITAVKEASKQKQNEPVMNLSPCLSSCEYECKLQATERQSDLA
jgi:hypothetical protein